jgi:hypothetical protein
VSARTVSETEGVAAENGVNVTPTCVYRTGCVAPVSCEAVQYCLHGSLQKQRAQIDAQAALSSKDRVEHLKFRHATPEHIEFMRLLEEYLRVLRIAEHNGRNADAPRQIVEAREALYEWARPAAETTTEQKYSEKDVAAITAAIDAAREAKSVTGECVGGRATLGGNDIMLLKVPSGSYGIGVRYAIRAVKTSAQLPAVVPDSILAQAESLPGQ